MGATEDDGCHSEGDGKPREKRFCAEHDLEVPSDAALGTDRGQQWVKQKASEGVTAVTRGRNPGGPGQGVAVEVGEMSHILTVSWR